jgi:uncharacterized protein (UPF0335 family)
MKDITTSISINGGPAVPVDLDAKFLRGRQRPADAARLAAARGPNTDLEEFVPAKPKTTEVGSIAADRLRSIVERIERLEEERKALASDIKDIYAEAKSAGFDAAVVRQIISLRRKEPAEVEEQETLLDLYKRALGM